jgi:hypothetical protein
MRSFMTLSQHPHRRAERNIIKQHFPTSDHRDVTFYLTYHHAPNIIKNISFPLHIQISGLNYYIFTILECDYRRVLDWWSDLLDCLIQRVTTLYSTLLHTHSLVSTVTSSLPLLGSSFQRRTFVFLWFPELSPTSATRFSQQQLTATEPQQSSNSLTHQPGRAVAQAVSR